MSFLHFTSNYERTSGIFVPCLTVLTTLLVRYARSHYFAPPSVVMGMSQKLWKLFGFAIECQRRNNIVCLVYLFLTVGAPLLLNFTLYALTYSIEVNPESATYNLQQTTISNFAAFSKITNKACYFMRIVCWQTILM